MIHLSNYRQCIIGYMKFRKKDLQQKATTIMTRSAVLDYGEERGKECPAESDRFCGNEKRRRNRV